MCSFSVNTDLNTYKMGHKKSTDEYKVNIRRRRYTTSAKIGINSNKLVNIPMGVLH